MKVLEIYKEIVAAVTSKPCMRYIILVQDKKEQEFIETALRSKLHDMLKRHMSHDRYRRQIIFDTVTGVRIRLIRLEDTKHFDMDTCGVTVDKWWSTIESLPEDVKLRLLCCTLMKEPKDEQCNIRTNL